MDNFRDRSDCMESWLDLCVSKLEKGGEMRWKMGRMKQVSMDLLFVVLFLV